MQYQVAVSFAGEQREFVEEVVRFLKQRWKLSVFYDADERTHLWGQSLAPEFTDIYENQAEVVVVFVSKEYAEKQWTRHEFKAALSGAASTDGVYILLAAFDETKLPGIASDLGRVDIGDATPAVIASKIAQQRGLSRFAGKASDEPPPRSKSLTGEVSFDYSAYNGRYTIGVGDLEFETRWSKAGNGQIYIYEDPSSIHGVAVAQHANSIDEVIHAASLDYTSRYRRPQTGQIVVLQNVSEFYAAVQILEVRAGTGNDDQDLLRFRYAIQSDGSESFGNFAGRLPD